MGRVFTWFLVFFNVFFCINLFYWPTKTVNPSTEIYRAVPNTSGKNKKQLAAFIKKLLDHFFTHTGFWSSRNKISILGLGLGFK